MAKKMKGCALVFSILFILSLACRLILGGGVLLTLTVTLGVFAYHFGMRLLVGWTVNALFHNQMNYRAKRFAPLPFEKRLYALLRVKKWKKHIPTYDPDTFSIKDKSLEQLAMATCQAETVHLIIVFLSFLPLLLAIPFGDLPVFLLTSLFAAGVDTVFILLQRFNRPTLLRLIDRQNGRVREDKDEEKAGR